ncbi:MAG TPA: Flp pilus assembly protein CpaB [Azospirillum sp.]|nr:Flp pilus assembly protein CpaB [Azospirillum sp.]
MAIRKVLLALAAVTFTGAAVVLLLPAPAPSPPVVQPVVKTQRIRVAASELPVGTFVQPSDVRWQDWPEAAVLKDHVIYSEAEADVAVGSVVRQSITAGEPLMRSRLIAPGDRGFLAAVLNPGTRAISVGVTEVSGAAGLILPGDRVDLILTQTAPVPGNNPGERSVGETVLTDARVIAVDQRVNELRSDPNPLFPGRSGAIGAARTVTLEVTARQAAKVAVAAELGRLTLSLRSLAEADPGEADGQDGPVWASDVSSALSRTAAAPPPETVAAPGPGILVVRGGSAARQSF